ncbi:MAG: tetratricopeptide repeat protein [Rhodocyclaceae bacterium]
MSLLNTLTSLATMPVFGIGLHILIALYFGIHAVRSRQNMYWVLILFMFPLLGSIVYFFAIYLPELRGSRGAFAVRRAINQAVSPARNLREARAAVEQTPTVGNRMKLAAALADAGQSQEALTIYREAATGPFADDPALLQGLARVQLECGQPAECAATLERLFAAHPETRRQPEPALRYALALANTNASGAREAFEAALVVAADPEPKCRYADWLRTQGNTADAVRARSLYEEIVKDSRFWPRYARNVNREWLQRAQSGLAAG